MNRLIVGDEGCSTNEIVTTIEKSSSARLLVQNWGKLANELKTPNQRLEELENDLLRNQKGVLEVVNQLLEEWSERLGSHAKFLMLLDILEEKCGWKEMAENLRINFRMKITNHTNWNDLDETSKQNILNRRVRYFGTEKTLKEVLTTTFDPDDQEALLNRALTGSLVAQLLATGPPIPLTLFQNPKTPDYYIPRKLSKRSVINPKIFHDPKCSDIFVFGGISYSHLITFTGKHKIDRSSSQVTSLTVRFIILEFEKDYKKICQISDVNAVHLFLWRNDKFYLNDTHGSLSMIQDYIAEEEQQETVFETDFWTVSPSPNIPLIIAGGSGSGKSTLLSNLYLKRKKQHPNTLMMLTSFPELFAFDDKNPLEEILSKDDAIRLISRYISADNELGREIVATLLEHDTHPFDIFLDGFHRIRDPERLLIVIEFLIVLSTKFQNVTIFATTATQQLKRQQIEEAMGHLSYNLLPFEQAEQISFLEQYWFHKCKITAPNQAVVKKFAGSLVSTFVHGTKCGQIAEIPLQCTMLAEIYFGDALKHSKNPSLDFAVLLKVNTIFDMYKWLITKRFHKIGDDDMRKNLTDMHVVAAVESLFPHLPQDISEVMGLSSCTVVDMEEINSIGILQPETENGEEGQGSSNQLTLEFVHQTYAEYLLANFLINILDEPPPEDVEAGVWSEALAELIFKNIMVCTVLADEDDNQKDGDDHLSSCFTPMTFRHPSICLFLNGCLGDSQEFRVTLKAVHISKLLLCIPAMVLVPQRICDILDTCIVHGYFNLFRLLAPFCLVLKSVAQQAVDQVPWQNLLFTATKYANLEFVEECCAYVELLLGLEIDQVTMFSDKTFHNTFVFNPLDVAIRRGDVLIFNFVLQRFQSRISEQIGLLHQCVQFSSGDSEEIINGKLRIMTILLGINREMLNEDEPISGTVPLLVPKVHWKILERLIEEGADTTAVTKQDDDTIAHKAAKTMTSEEFDKFCQLIVDKELGEIFRKQNKALQTPLHIALERMQVSPNTLSLLCSQLKLNLNNVNGEKMTELFCAVAGGQSRAILEIIQEFGGDPRHLGKDNQTILHVAAVHGNIPALDHFISLGCKVNARDSNKCTPLHITLTEGGRNLDDIFVTAIKHKADLYASDNKGNTPMASAMKGDHVWKLDAATVGLLKKSGVKKGFWNCFKKSK